MLVEQVQHFWRIHLVADKLLGNEEVAEIRLFSPRLTVVCDITVIPLLRPKEVENPWIHKI